MADEALRNALAKAAALPTADRERIGRDFGAYIDDLKTLRAMIDEADRSLEAGEAKEIDIAEFLARMRANAD